MLDDILKIIEYILPNLFLKHISVMSDFKKLDICHLIWMEYSTVCSSSMPPLLRPHTVLLLPRLQLTSSGANLAIWKLCQTHSWTSCHCLHPLYLLSLSYLSSLSLPTWQHGQKIIKFLLQASMACPSCEETIIEQTISFLTWDRIHITSVQLKLVMFLIQGQSMTNV